MNENSASIAIDFQNDLECDAFEAGSRKQSRRIGATRSIDKILLASIVVPRQRQGLRAGRDRRRGPTVKQRRPIAGGGGRVLPIASQSGTTSGSRARSTYADTDTHADATGSSGHHLFGVYHAARLDDPTLVHVHLLVRRGPVLVVHEVMRVRGRRRGRR